MNEVRMWGENPKEMNDKKRKYLLFTLTIKLFTERGALYKTIKGEP